jgi:hypothetical protein
MLSVYGRPNLEQPPAPAPQIFQTNNVSIYQSSIGGNNFSHQQQQQNQYQQPQSQFISHIKSPNVNDFDEFAVNMLISKVSEIKPDLVNEM